MLQAEAVFCMIQASLQAIYNSSAIDSTYNCVCSSHGKNLRELREFIFHEIPFSVISNLDMLEVLDLSNNYFMGMDQVFFDVLNRKQKPRLKMVYLQVCTTADICFCLSLKKSRKNVVILPLQY